LLEKKDAPAQSQAMRRLANILLLFSLALAAPARDDSAAALQAAGEFTAATAAWTKALRDGNLTQPQREEAERQIDWMARVRLDYSLSRAALGERISKAVRDVTPEELDRWIAAGWFDKMKIDGADEFVGVSVSNLFYRHPELAARRLNAKSSVAEQKGRLEMARAITRAARAAGSPYVLPHHFQCTMTVTAKPDAAAPGALVRAWLPIPRAYPFQNEFKMEQCSPAPKEIEPEDSPIRSVYLEELAAPDQPTTFRIAYDYTAWGVHFELDPAKAQAPDLHDPALKKFTLEAPHVVFTDKILSLAHDLAGGSTNPLTRARSAYEWIAHNVKYSFAREYSTLTNISDYCLSHGYGDCGQEALLFITLCRAQGIPARWQTGWNIFPGAKDIHDWTEIYVAPYGWMPVDPWAGIFATQECDALTPGERAEVRDFYFGGLDYDRMIANCDHDQTLHPRKTSARSDDVDFQRGELESGGRNIYFDKYTYDLQVHELNEAR
jgi:transglutaminase-like putative cysteine protease